jgi:hypothetical protein
MNFQISCALAVSSGICLGAFGIQEPKLTLVDDPEAYAVYASLLPNEWIVRVQKAQMLVILEETVTNWECMPSGPPLQTTWKAVLDDYKAANASVRRIRAGQPLGLPYEVVPARVIRATFEATIPNTDRWSGFYRKYPRSGGILQLSAVGFDRARARAMVYMAHDCGGLCGGGQHYLLEKVDGAWRSAEIPDLVQCVWDS